MTRHFGAFYHKGKKTMKHEQMVILYISLDGGHSYRQARFTEQTFKERMWLTACKWLRPDGDMLRELYATDIVVRYEALDLAGIIRVSGGCKLENIWKDISDLWDKIKVES